MPKRKNSEDSNGSELSTNDEIVVVKKGLAATCKNQMVYDKIQKDVTEMSALIVEASVHIHYSLMKRWAAGDFSKVNFLDYYYPLMQKKKDKYKLDPDYEQLRVSMPLYDSAFRSNIFVDSAKQYAVIFHNNIWMHAYNRLRRFFKPEPDKRKVYQTLSYLFETKSAHLPDDILLERLKTELDWNGEKLDKLKLKDRFWDSMPLFYNLQRYNERNNLKNFALIPIRKHGLHHIRYDSFAFQNLLSGLKLYKPKPKILLRDEWFDYFKFPETHSKKYNHSMQTDGVSISFSMKKTKSNISNATTTAKRKKKQKDETQSCGDLLKIRNTIYDDRIGLDPGMRLIYGGVKNGKPIKLKNSTYQSMIGYHARKMQLAKFTKYFTEKSQESPHQTDYTAYARYRLGTFMKRQQIFGQRKVARLKLKKFICVEKTAHKIAAELVPHPKIRNTLICIGSTEIAAASPMRGYIRTPNRKLIAALKARRADILLVNEFRTTKLCGNCHQENKTSKSPHRYQFCPNCHTCWNRDVNAGVNILYLGECVINEIDKDENFKLK